MSTPPRLTFDVTPHRPGDYTARCREADLVAEGATQEELMASAQKAAEAHFADQRERGLPAIDFIFAPFEPKRPRPK